MRLRTRFIAALALLCLGLGNAWAGPAGLADCSGTIASGGASQALVAQSLDRAYLMIANPAAAGGANLGVSLATGAGGSSGAAAIASAGTMTLAPGQSFVFDGTAIASNGLNIVGPNTSQAYTCWRAR